LLYQEVHLFVEVLIICFVRQHFQLHQLQSGLKFERYA
jgi:hypothetical protein